MKVDGSVAAPSVDRQVEVLGIRVELRQGGQLEEVRREEAVAARFGQQSLRDGPGQREAVPGGSARLLPAGRRTAELINNDQVPAVDILRVSRQLPRECRLSPASP